MYVCGHLTEYICVVYIVKEVASFRGAWSINGHGMQMNTCSSYTKWKLLYIAEKKYKDDARINK